MRKAFRKEGLVQSQSSTNLSSDARRALGASACCPICRGHEWVCERHPDKPWDETLDGGCECGAGMPCSFCRSMAEPDVPCTAGRDGPKPIHTSVGFIVWSDQSGPYPKHKGKPFRLYPNRSTALKMAEEWQWPDHRDGTLSAREVFIIEGY